MSRSDIHSCDFRKVLPPFYRTGKIAEGLISSVAKAIHLAYFPGRGSGAPGREGCFFNPPSSEGDCLKLATGNLGSERAEGGETETPCPSSEFFFYFPLFFLFAPKDFAQSVHWNGCWNPSFHRVKN